MKNRILDALAVALLYVVMAFLGCAMVLLSTATAKADVDDPVVVSYAAHYGGAVCSTLDDYPSFDGIVGIGQAIHEDGLSYSQAGQVIALSVSELCPRHLGLVLRFADTYGHEARQIA